MSGKEINALRSLIELAKRSNVSVWITPKSDGGQVIKFSKNFPIRSIRMSEEDVAEYSKLNRSHVKRPNRRSDENSL